MNDSPIDALKPFHDPEDWRRMMATMVEPALRAQIAGQSQVMNEPWMRLIVDGGLLRLPDACKTPHEDLGAFQDGVEQWAHRLADFNRFTSESWSAITKDAWGEDMCFLGHGGSQGVKEVFARASAEVVADHQTLMSHPMAPEGHAATAALEAMTLWTAGAIVLDLPDTVAQIVKTVPAVAEGMVPIESLGKDLGEFLRHLETGDGQKREGNLSAQLTAQGVALLLSRETCLDALWANGVSPLSKLGDHVTTGPGWSGADGAKVHTVQFFADDLPLHLVPMFAPHVWGKTLKKLLDDPNYDTGWREDLYALAIGELITDERPWMNPYVPALINAGVYHIDPMNSMSVAVGVGAMQVLSAVLPSVDWNSHMTELTFAGHDSPLARAAVGIAYGPADEREACVLKVMDAAVAADRCDLVTSKAMVKATGGKSLVPLFGLASAGFKRAVLKSIEHGWDPKSNPPGSEGVPTLLEYCDLVAPDVAHAIRTSAARAKAFGALADFEKPSPRRDPL